MRNKKTLTWEDYGKWIVCEWIYFPDYDIYTELFQYLHSISFRSIVVSDNHRKVDGERIRNDFIEEHRRYDISDDVFNSECSVLEVLASLAFRLEHEYIGRHMIGSIDDLNKPKEYKLFFEMITNLGLNEFSDYDYDSVEVNNIIDYWLDRCYDNHGEGSIFPLINARKGYKRWDIWEQAMAYISENYGR